MPSRPKKKNSCRTRRTEVVKGVFGGKPNFELGNFTGAAVDSGKSSVNGEA